MVFYWSFEGNGHSMKIKKIEIHDIEGFVIGNAEDTQGGTGCTVIISEEGAVGGVDVRGGGPATRETDLLKSENTVEAINAVVLSGGSAFGLEAASGVMRALAQKGIGFKVGDITVPIVTGASLFDLAVGSSDVFPDREMGYEAVANAYNGVFEAGNHGAGTGASCGKMLGMHRAMKSGLGTFACGDDLVKVGAIAAVNACADIYNGAGNIIAGLRTSDGSTIQGTISVLKGMIHPESETELRFEDIKVMAEEEQALSKVINPPKEEEKAEPSADSKTDIAKAIQAAYDLASVQDEQKIEEAVQPEEPEVKQDIPEEIIAEEHIADIPVAEPEAVLTKADVSAATEEDNTVTAEAEVPAENVIAAKEPAAVPFIYEKPEQPVVHFEETPVSVEFADVREAECPESEEVVAPEEPVYHQEVAEPVTVAETAPEEAVSPEPVPAETTEPAEFESVDAYEPEVIPETPVQAAPEEPVEEAVVEEPDPFELSEEEKLDMGYDIPFNTTIGCLITNARLTKSQANKLASILHDAYARAIKPVHSTLDGDTIFVMSTCTQDVNFDAFAALATDVMQYAIIDGAQKAEGAYGLPAARDIIRK